MKPSVKTQVMNAIAELNRPLRFSEIQKIVVAITLKKEYDWRTDRGQFTSAIRSYFQKPGSEPRYLKRDADGFYHLVQR